MSNPNYRILEAIAHVKMQTALRPVTPVSPLTDEEIQALHAFCEMWSQMWEHGPFPMRENREHGYLAQDYVRRSE